MDANQQDMVAQFGAVTGANPSTVSFSITASSLIVY